MAYHMAWCNKLQIILRCQYN